MHLSPSLTTITLDYVLRLDLCMEEVNSLPISRKLYTTRLGIVRTMLVRLNHISEVPEVTIILKIHNELKEKQARW